MSKQIGSRFPDDLNMRFSLRVEMVHPSVKPDKVSKALGWEPGWTWEPETGAVDETVQARAGFGWGTLDTWGGERLFFRRVVAMLGHLEGRREFVCSYVQTGGEVVFTVRLFGKVNIGDVLAPEDMMRMAMLGIGLQIQVAPEWD